MSSPVITIENLGKSYRLTHQAERQRYTALRDVIAEKARNVFRRRPSRGLNGTAHTEEFWALKDVSLDIRQGEVVGIIGRNGAGKSTLLKILSRITEPTTGRVKIGGRVASLLEVGTGFHPELTGRENIYLNGAILGMTRVEIRRKFDEIVAFAEVERFLDTPVKRYSSGMYVRLAFAVAAHLEPEILIVDEVLAVGDAEFQKKCLGKMEHVSKEHGRTVLFVSHNMAAVQSLCGVGLLLDRGRLRHLGSIDSAIADYNASIRGGAGRDGTSSMSLGPALSLRSVQCQPEAIRSGGPMCLSFELVPQEPTLVKEFAVLIYSEYGARVAVLDLRREGIVDLPIDDNPLKIEICVDALPLVEGDYRLGVYLVTNHYAGNYLDLTSFTVASNLRPCDMVPYAREHRGFIEIDFFLKKGVAETMAL